MAGWVAKRFWQQAEACPCAGGFTVTLDGRAVKTPAKTPLVVPTRALAQAIADEWQAQEGIVRPDTMPCTRSTNSALDKVTPQFDAVVNELAGYGATDLLCYRATGPARLIDMQAAAWDPLLLWAAAALDAPLRVTHGVVPIDQPAASLAALAAQVRGQSAFQLAGFHDLVAISGSLILALAVTQGRLTVDQAWTLSRLDETWQAELWGADDEAAESDALRRVGFAHAGRFYGLCG
ncbi:ATPase [Fertoebacter nigrum]|uniref:ATPase n=1 Tax=Fertoeibacter niger TaxID=2656921 RepID=A0A8X8H047_9RHOB|nr:ATP12 family protein [Fertoeibacter niger]NUB44500.1 ATPase [Fertoeibacter niger]